MNTACKLCGGDLGTEAARMIGVCTGCIAASHAPRTWPQPPSYSWNPQTRPASDAHPPRPD